MRSKSAALIIGVAALTAGQARDADSDAGIKVTDAWIRALPAGIPSGGYFTLYNGSQTPLVLTGATSPGCGTLMMHKSEDRGGMMQMRGIAEVDVPAGGTVKFAPGGYHLMCMDASVKPGGAVPVTLSFTGKASMKVRFAVRGATGK